jgi:hypothetical protein
MVDRSITAVQQLQQCSITNSAATALIAHNTLIMYMYACIHVLFCANVYREDAMMAQSYDCVSLHAIYAYTHQVSYSALTVCRYIQAYEMLFTVHAYSNVVLIW